MPRMLAWPLIGFILGVLFVWLTLHGYSAQWQGLLVAPFPIATLLASQNGGVYVRAADTLTYRCGAYSDTCWTREALPASDGYVRTTTTPSTTGTLLFFKFYHPLTPILDCVQGTTGYVDGSGLHAAVLDTANYVWLWSSIPTGGEVMVLIWLFPFTGLIIGGAVSGLLISTTRTH